MPLSPAAVPREHWRHLLRSLLRECTYLPDPIAKGYMHDHVVERFRRYSGPKIHENDKHKKFHRGFSTPRKIKNDINRQHQLRKAGKQQLTLLRRANEGYSKPLEKVLQLSYGRTGKRRKDLLERLIAPEVPADTQEVAELIKKPFMFDDGWKPPSMMVDLAKSQKINGSVHELAIRPQIRSLEPQIPKENSWGRPLNRVRRRNIRKDWYFTALNALFPPLPDEELDILQGLVHGTQNWVLPKRRKAVGPPPNVSSVALDTKFLVEGPSKGHTFRVFANGRPHNITPRFMRRLWRRVLCLVPRMSWNDVSKKHNFSWEPLRQLPTVSLAMASESDIFRNVDSQGRVIKDNTAKRKRLDADHIEWPG